MKNDSKILVAGSSGLVGNAIVRTLKGKGYTNVVLGTRKLIDFQNQAAVENFFKEYEFEYVFLAAAKVGGILANSTYPADFMYNNIMIQSNIIESAYKNKVKKLLFLGSSCIYPKFAAQPITEDQLLTGPLEPSNAAYAIAKIAGLKMCESYNQQYGFNAISVMPCNLYGPNDNFDLNNSHVIPAMIRRFHEAKENKAPTVTCWGDGSAMREFLFVDDMAEACYVCMQHYNSLEFLNIGAGEEISIKVLAETVANVVGYQGDIVWDTSKPNGTPRKVLNVDKIKALGWKPTISLEDGLRSSYEWYCNQV